MIEGNFIARDLLRRIELGAGRCVCGADAELLPGWHSGGYYCRCRDRCSEGSWGETAEEAAGNFKIRNTEHEEIM